MKLAALTIAMLLLTASAQAFEGNDRILDVDQYQKLPPNSPYDAVASGYVAPAAIVRRVDYVPYGSQVTRTEYGTGYVAPPSYGYVAQPTYGYVAQPTYVAPRTYGYVAQPTYGYVAPPSYGYVETRRYGYAVPRIARHVVPRTTGAPRVYGYTSAPRVSTSPIYCRQNQAGAPALK